MHKKIKHPCNECGKLFAQRSSLYIHKKTVHEGIKSFECNKCGKFFSQKNNLKIHIQMLHEGVPFFCNLCKKMFKNPQSVYNHKKFKKCK